MPKVVSVIPKIKSNDGRFHQTKGTQVLLDDGSYLEGVTKITLVAEVGKPGKQFLRSFRQIKNKLMLFWMNFMLLSAE